MSEFRQAHIRSISQIGSGESVVNITVISEGKPMVIKSRDIDRESVNEARAEASDVPMFAESMAPPGIA